MSALARIHVSKRLVHVVELACRSTCRSVCSVNGVVEMVLAHMHDDVLGIFNRLCVSSDTSDSGRSDCVDGLVNYVCSRQVQRCMTFTASRGEAMSECVTRASGTFGDMHEPWSEHSALALWIAILVLAVCVFWHSCRFLFVAR